MDYTSSPISSSSSSVWWLHADNASTLAPTPSSSLGPWAEEGSGELIRLEQVVFLACIVIVAVLALPPNLLLLLLATHGLDPGGHRASRGRGGSSRWWRGRRFPVLLVSQLVVNVLISLTSPLDALFLAGQGSRQAHAVHCLLFLAVKSVLLLLSVLLVCLQGMDKVYRVRNLHRLLQPSRLRLKVLGVVLALGLSCLPMCLALGLSRGRALEMRQGCHVSPEVVDVTEAIFFLGFFLSFLSFVAVVGLLFRHTRQVAAVEDAQVTVISASPRVLPSVSEVFEDSGGAAGSGSSQVQSSAAPLQESILPGPGHSRPHPPARRSLSQGVPAPVIQLETSPTIRQLSVSSLPVADAQCLSPQDSCCFFQADPATLTVQSSAPSTGTRGGVVTPQSAYRRTSRGSIRWFTFCTPSDVTGRRHSAATFASGRSRSASTSSSVTQRRLESAAVTAVKRGALSLVIFLVCYLPLMVALLVLSQDQPVYETALLLEGLTLPIIYVHTLVSPLLAIRVDSEWRTQASELIDRWLRCRKKTRS